MGSPVPKPVAVEPRLPHSNILLNILRSPLKTRLALAGLTLACLMPFLGKAFHVDDTLFLWAAKYIVKHPTDPFGFNVVWDYSSTPMWNVTKNPPLAAYFLALVGSWAGWSEHVLHFEFLAFALIVILATYHLAREMTRFPVLAACATLATPGFLVSATSVMCDVPMLAIWLLAIIFWRRGVRENKILWLAVSGILIGMCALTKYFGVSLIPLLLAYSTWSKRRLGRWAVFLLIPVAVLAAYQVWTTSLYGQGLLSDLASYAGSLRGDSNATPIGSLLETLSFVGGCSLPALLMVPSLWSRKWTVPAAIFAVLAATAIALGWVAVESRFPDDYRVLLALQLALFTWGGVSVLCLAFADFWQRRDSDSILLLLWILGTFVFTAFLNWTINARSVLPMIPAIGLLVARRFENRRALLSLRRVVIPMTICLVISLWVTAGDAAWADSARNAAVQIHRRAVAFSKQVMYSGHWGFQYYMDLYGGKPLDSSQPDPTSDDVVVLPRNNTNQVMIRVAPVGTLHFDTNIWVSTNQAERGTGFYSSEFGPLPYAFAPPPQERYDFYRINAAR